MDVLNEAITKTFDTYLDKPPGIFITGLTGLIDSIKDRGARAAAVPICVRQLSVIVESAKRAGVSAKALALNGDLVKCYGEPHELRALRVCYAAAEVDQLVEFYHLLAVVGAIKRGGFRVALRAADEPAPLRQSEPVKVVIVGQADRFVTTTVERDEAGEISKTHQLHTDLQPNA